MKKIYQYGRIVSLLLIQLLFLVYNQIIKAQTPSDFIIITTSASAIDIPDGTASIIYGGSADLIFEYAVDNYNFRSDNPLQFNNLSAGKHLFKIRIKEEDGSCACESCISTIPFIIGLPFFKDADGDGYGDGTSPWVPPIAGTPMPQDYVSNGLDCNDQNFNVNPGSSEICDSIDNNCDGITDPLPFCIPPTKTYYKDGDGDGYGGSGLTVPADYPMPTGYVSNDKDCNDNNPNIHPGAAEISDDDIDNNCDGVFRTSVMRYIDDDEDGFGSYTVGLFPDYPSDFLGFSWVYNYGDCNDNDNAINPGANLDVCDGKNNDCDGLADEDEPPKMYAADADQDGYVSPFSPVLLGCTVPPGFKELDRRYLPIFQTDCNDNDPTIFSFAPEICDGKDNNCNGLIDEDCPKQEQTITLETIPDKLVGDASFTINATATSNLPVEFALSTSLPGIATLVNGNEVVIIGEGEVTLIATQVGNDTYYAAPQEIGSFQIRLKQYYYLDNDGDSYGDAAISLFTSVPPEGYVEDNTDFDDEDINSYPGASEICDEKDNDNNGDIDEGLEELTYYKDADLDGYGSSADSKTSCSAPAGYVRAGGDCNDANPLIYPGASELCNGKDDNCNGTPDEGFTQTTYYKDADADGYGNLAQAATNCKQPPGFVTNNQDCDDSNASIHPEAFDDCDGIDNNCNGQVDEETLFTFYQDSDNDGFGNALVNQLACSPPAGYRYNAEDCDDANASIYPGATEIGNNIDDDCDGVVDDNVVKQNQIITFTPVLTKTFGDAPFFLNAFASSELEVTYTMISGPATISGSTLTITGAGEITVRATQEGNVTYNPATLEQTFIVNKANPIVIWHNPAGIAEGTALSATQLNATANIPGTFIYTPAAGTILPPGNNQQLSVAFLPDEDANYIPIPSTKVIITVNGAPVLAMTGPTQVNEGTLITRNSSTTDVNGDAITYSLVGTIPIGVSIQPTSGTVTWTPTEAQGPGPYTISVRATDNGFPALHDEESISISVTEVNELPVLSAIGNKTVATGRTLGFTLSATDVDLPKQVLTYSANPLPAGATLIANSGIFSWTPAPSQAGSYSILFKATDGALEAQETVIITVTKKEVSTTPVISGISPSSGPIGTMVTVSGSNFTDVSRVAFNGVEAGTYIVENAASIKATVPNGATSGKVSVITPGGTAVSKQTYTVTVPPAPSITSFTPTSGPIGTMVMINGKNFLAPITVSFAGVPATEVSLSSSTSLIARVPARATTGAISVTALGGTATSKKNYTVAEALISSVYSSEQSLDLASEPGMTVHPNPFNRTTKVSFILSKDGFYRLSLLDAKGKQISVLSEGLSKAGKLIEVEVNGKGLASGTYLLRLESTKRTKTLRLVFER